MSLVPLLAVFFLERTFKSMKGSMPCCSEQKINGFRIMRGVEKHFIYRAQVKRCLNSTVLMTKLTASCREAGCSLGYKGKSCLLSAAEIMYRWYPLKYFSGHCPSPSRNRAGSKDDDGCNRLYRGHDNRKWLCFEDRQK